MRHTGGELMTKTYEEIVALVRDTLVDAGSTFREDKKEAYRNADYFSISALSGQLFPI